MGFGFDVKSSQIVFCLSPRTIILEFLTRGGVGFLVATFWFQFGFLVASYGYPQASSKVAATDVNTQHARDAAYYVGNAGNASNAGDAACKDSINPIQLPDI